jgi:hypothetical protein
VLDDAIERLTPQQHGPTGFLQHPAALLAWTLVAVADDGSLAANAIPRIAIKAIALNRKPRPTSVM